MSQFSAPNWITAFKNLILKAEKNYNRNNPWPTDIFSQLAFFIILNEEIMVYLF
jgi:hypothetical protein